jgi:hypothetical protein
MTADGKRQEVGDKVCDGCGNFDPWSPESAPAFYNVTTCGKREFIHQMSRRLRKYCLQHGCTKCKIIGIALMLHGEFDKGEDEDLLKMRITDPPGAAGIIIGHHKMDRLEIFSPPSETLVFSIVWIMALNL